MRKNENNNSSGHEFGSPPGTPRWVKVIGIIVIVLVLGFVISIFISGGGHGPGRHIPSSSVVEKGMKQPWS